MLTYITLPPRIFFKQKVWILFDPACYSVQYYIGESFGFNYYMYRYIRYIISQDKYFAIILSYLIEVMYLAPKDRHLRMVVIHGAKHVQKYIN